MKKLLCVLTGFLVLCTGCSAGTEETPVSYEDGVDSDLTLLSGTVVYSVVYNMVNTPDAYMGKVIRMGGICSPLYNEASGDYDYFCVIQDATACCQQGIGFELVDGYTYPEEGEEIVVTGVFDTYTEGNMRYCVLRNAVRE